MSCVDWSESPLFLQKLWVINHVTHLSRLDEEQITASLSDRKHTPLIYNAHITCYFYKRCSDSST